MNELNEDNIDLVNDLIKKLVAKDNYSDVIFINIVH